MAINPANEVAGASNYPSTRLRQRERKVLESANSLLEDFKEISPANLSVSGTLTSAQLLAMNATPVALIAAPGAGKCVVIESAQLFLDYNSVAYAADAGEDLVLRYAGTSVYPVQIDDADALIEGTADQHVLAKPTATLDLDAAANKAIQAAILVGEWASGNSPIKYKINYKIIDLLS